MPKKMMLFLKVQQSKMKLNFPKILLSLKRINNTIYCGPKYPGTLQILGVLTYTRGYIIQVDTIHRGVQGL